MKTQHSNYYCIQPEAREPGNTRNTNSNTFPVLIILSLREITYLLGLFYWIFLKYGRWKRQNAQSGPDVSFLLVQQISEQWSFKELAFALTPRVADFCLSFTDLCCSGERDETADPGRAHGGRTHSPGWLGREEEVVEVLRQAQSQWPLTGHTF